jgi:ubiquinone/menaquinone biosynthesis C-methylase UbiE
MAAAHGFQPEGKEHPSTYIVQDRSNTEEMMRIDIQDRLITERMGGVLPEQPEPVRFQYVLDVGCGPGWWLIETAKTYPVMARLVGVDISERMISYASSRPELVAVSDRVQFQTGDALRMLDFPDNTFELVNQRFGISYLRKWDWPKLLREYQRVSQPGGVIRITETGGGENSSPALMRLAEILHEAFYYAGHYFTPGPEGIVRHLAGMMKQYGIEDVQTKTYQIAFHENPQALRAFVDDMHRAFRTVLPFLRKWTKFSDDYEQLYLQMLDETQHPSFKSTSTIITAWGKKRDSYLLGTKL